MRTTRNTPCRDDARSHFTKAKESLRNAGEHAAGTVVVPIAMTTMLPAVFIPYAGLLMVPALEAGVFYTLNAPRWAAEEVGEAAKHAWLGVKVGLGGNCD